MLRWFEEKFVCALGEDQILLSDEFSVFVHTEEVNVISACISAMKSCQMLASYPGSSLDTRLVECLHE